MYIYVNQYTINILFINAEEVLGIFTSPSFSALLSDPRFSLHEGKQVSESMKHLHQLPVLIHGGMIQVHSRKCIKCILESVAAFLQRKPWQKQHTKEANSINFH